MTISYLYKITNRVNNKCYIGVSKDPINRFKAHCSKSSTCTKLKNAISKYGKDNFELKVLCKGEINYISELEGKAIDIYDSRENGYNILYGHHSKNLNSPPEVGERISESLNKYYETNVSNNLGRRYDSCYNDNPVYVLGFWFPSVRFCEKTFNKYYSWVIERNGSEQEYISPKKSLRKDCKYQGSVYVGGFWWPDLNCASEHLKMSKSHLATRLQRGYVEAFSTAMSEGKKSNRNPMASICGEKHPNSRKVSIEGTTYCSVTEAIKKSGYTKKQIHNRLRSEKFHDFFYVT